MPMPLVRGRWYLAGLPLVFLAACGSSGEGLGTTLPTLPPTVVPTTPTTVTATTVATTTAPRATAPTGGPNTLPPIPELTTLPGQATTTIAGTAPATGPIQYVDEPASGALRLGNKGPRVQAMQGQLVTVGYRIGVDGYFGRGTEAAVRAFQEAQSLQPADGVATDPTLQRLGQLAPAG